MKVRRARISGAANPVTIGFRLPEESCRALVERADSLGVSPHELARSYVMQVLAGGANQPALDSAVRTMDGRLETLQVDLELIQAGQQQQQEGQGEFVAAVDLLLQRVAALQEDLKVMAVALLVSAGKATEKEAVAWAREHLD